MNRRLLLACLFLLVSCGRPLTTGEQEFAATLFGPEFDPGPVRVASFNGVDGFTTTRPKRPRVACRERIWPEPKTDTVSVGTAAFVLFNQINISSEIYFDDYMSAWPETFSLPAAMLIAHEMTHIWQWQNRARTGYHPLKAAQEHKPGTDPYLLEFTADSRFLDFPYEQQGAIVEEYVCCRSLDPQGSRTQRLHKMLKATFPVEALDHHLNPRRVKLPWDGAKVRGICS